MQKEILRLDALDGIEVWLPDLHIFELREDEELLKEGESGLVRGQKESDVSLSSAGGDQASGNYKVLIFFSLQGKNIAIEKAEIH